MHSRSNRCDLMRAGAKGGGACVRRETREGKQEEEREREKAGEEEKEPARARKKGKKENESDRM